MNFEVAKAFDRNGVRYRTGDPLPPDLDKSTLAHYERHGMIRSAERAPAEKKPATPRNQPRAPRAPAPQPQQPAHTKMPSQHAAQPGALAPHTDLQAAAGTAGVGAPDAAGSPQANAARGESGTSETTGQADTPSADQSTQG